MKLLKKSQLLFLRFSLPVFAGGGLLMLYVLRMATNHHTDERLRDVAAEIRAFVWLYHRLPGFFESANDRLYVAPAPPGNIYPYESFADTSLYNEVQRTNQPFRRLRFPLQMNGQWWQATLMQSTIELDDLALTVTLILLLFFGLLLLVLILVNRRVSEQAWTPFFETLGRMRRFRLTDAAPPPLEPSDVDEFRELNATLAYLTDQLQKDFRTVKRFTENASHELQTPLAIIQNKVEAMLQDETLDEAQTRRLDIIGQSARRMARLNQALLLLSKIENHQFSERRPVDLKPLFEKKLLWLEDIVAQKKLAVSAILADVSLVINPFLAETLVSNLVVNAVKHNLPGGFLHIDLDAAGITVVNSAAPPTVPVEQLADRFVRGNEQAEGAGLGLAIVAEICDQQGLRLETGFADGVWRSRVVFPSGQSNFM